MAENQIYIMQKITIIMFYTFETSGYIFLIKIRL